MGNCNRSRKHCRVNRRAVAPPVIAHELLILLRTQPRLSLQRAKGNRLLLSLIGAVFHVERKAGFPLSFRIPCKNSGSQCISLASARASSEETPPANFIAVEAMTVAARELGNCRRFW